MCRYGSPTIFLVAICLQGDFQASFMYKDVTLATSSPQKYKDLKYREAQVLKVSAGVSGEDIYGLIGKDITEDMKGKKEVRFGTRFYLTDCREKTTGTMRYACDDVTLRFEPGSEMKAALFGMNPRCVLEILEKDEMVRGSSTTDQQSVQNNKQMMSYEN
ncbi:hypothetical protein Bca101_099878 [Brassica carinata]